MSILKDQIKTKSERISISGDVKFVSKDTINIEHLIPNFKNWKNYNSLIFFNLQKLPLPFFGLSIFGLNFLVNNSFLKGFFFFNLVTIFFTNNKLFIIKAI